MIEETVSNEPNEPIGPNDCTFISWPIFVGICTLAVIGLVSMVSIGYTLFIYQLGA